MTAGRETTACCIDDDGPYHLDPDGYCTGCGVRRETTPENFLADLDKPQYDLVERPGKGLTARLSCIRCQGPRRNGSALCRRCRWSPIRVVRVWWHTR